MFWLHFQEIHFSSIHLDCYDFVFLTVSEVVAHSSEVESISETACKKKGSKKENEVKVAIEWWNTKLENECVFANEENRSSNVGSQKAK